MDNFIYPIALIISYGVYKVYKLFQVPKEIQHIPEISFLSLLKSTLCGQPLDEQYEEIRNPVTKKFGYARVWVQGNWEIVVTDPNNGREILNNTEAFLKRPKNGERLDQRMLLSKFFNNKSIGGSDGNEWRRHRRIANPAFKKNWDHEMFGECTRELIDKINETNQQPVEVHSLFQNLTLDALGRGLFSYDFQAVKKGEQSHYLKLYNEVLSAAFSPLYMALPFLEEWVPSRRYYHKRNDEFRGFLLGIIKERQTELKSEIQKNDLLSLMIKASMDETEKSAKLSDEEVLNDLITFFLAGHDTTANTLGSTFYYLAKHPEIQEKARQEVLKVLGSHETVITPTHDQLKEMPYIACIIKESMRIITTAAQLRRYCHSDITLDGGLTIRKDSFIRVDQWSIHHDPNLFPEPYRFNPDRFSEIHGPQDQAWMAFGAGSRMCIGLNFSLIEQKIVMTNLLQKFTMKLGPNSGNLDKPVIKPSGLACPANVDICFTPRI